MGVTEESRIREIVNEVGEVRDAHSPLRMSPLRYEQRKTKTVTSSDIWCVVVDPCLRSFALAGAVSERWGAARLRRFCPAARYDPGTSGQD